MAQILNRVHDLDPNNSEAVKETISVFFQNIIKCTEVDCKRWLRALENVINRFPKYCMSHRSTIETYLVNFLSANNYSTVIEAAKCAHVLQQVRPIQEKSATAKSCWRDQMNVLCKAVQSLLGAIFPNAVDIYKGNHSEDEQTQSSNSPLVAALKDLSNTKGLDKDVNRQSLLCTRLRNVFVFLQAMLVEIYPVAKPIQPQTILGVLVRALSVSSSDQTRSTQNICTIKTQALRTVDALIASLGSNLVPFSALVTRFVMQTLRWSSDNTTEESSEVRCAAYSTLVRWLGVLHAHRISNDGRARSWEDELTKHITDDVTPVKHVVQLTMNSQPTRKLSKKAKRKLANSMLQESRIASHMPGERNKITVSEEMNDVVAIAALECAEAFLTVCGIFLKPTTHKVFQERLVRECYSMDYSSERTLALLRALEAERKSTPPHVPPPTQYCLQLYSSLVNSQQREISKFCTQALLDIRLHLHCSPPSLNFAMEVPVEKHKNGEDKRKKMSERNRATLDALLGISSDTPDNIEEVITIQDEPASKKPRIEEELDKISISSSDSSIDINSVEINDESDEEIEIVPVLEVNKRNEFTEGGEMNALEEIDGPTNNTIDKEYDEETENILESVVSDTVCKSTDPKENQSFAGEQNIQVPECIEQNETQLGTGTNIFGETETNIFDAKTQLPVVDVSNDTTEDYIPLSAEIAYDLPNTAKVVPVLQKMDEENLPSTNDTDDIQITCGQKIRSSQDAEAEKTKELDEKTDDVPKVNGNKSPENIPEDNVPVPEITESITVKISTAEGVSLDDMLADFVDEVNEDNKI